MAKELIKDRLFLKKLADSYVLHRIKDGILTIEGDAIYNIAGIEPFYKLSLKNCQAIEQGYDLDELAEEWVFEKNSHKWSNNDDTAGDNYASFKEGFQKALKLMGDKKFSEEDMNKAFRLGHSLQTDITLKNKKYKPSGHFFEELIQSLQPTKWDVEIVMTEPHKYEMCSNPKNHISCLTPKLDADGCLILKKI